VGVVHNFVIVQVLFSSLQEVSGVELNFVIVQLLFSSLYAVIGHGT
jgi:hypothetical protein